MSAARINKPEILKMLLGAGAQINTQNKNGYSALIVAVLHGSEEHIKTLVNYEFSLQNIVKQIRTNPQPTTYLNRLPPDLSEYLGKFKIKPLNSKLTEKDNGMTALQLAKHEFAFSWHPYPKHEKLEEIIALLEKSS